MSIVHPPVIIKLKTSSVSILMYMDYKYHTWWTIVPESIKNKKKIYMLSPHSPVMFIYYLFHMWSVTSWLWQKFIRCIRIMSCYLSIAFKDHYAQKKQCQNNKTSEGHGLEATRAQPFSGISMDWPIQLNQTVQKKKA